MRVYKVYGMLGLIILAMTKIYLSYLRIRFAVLAVLAPIVIWGRRVWGLVESGMWDGKGGCRRARRVRGWLCIKSEIEK